MKNTFGFRVIGMVLIALALFGGVAMYTPQTIANHLECSDGVDNDNDGEADYPLDSQCESTEDDSESLGGSSSSASSRSSSSSSVGLNIAISDGKTTIHSGDSLIYVITLSQSAPASKVVDVDLYLPTSVNTVSPDQGGSVSGNRVRWNDITLTQNQQQRLTVQVNISPNAAEGTPLVARVIADGTEVSDTTTVQNSPQQAAAFQAFVTDDRQAAAPNDTLSYRITILNPSTQTQTADVTLTVSPFITVEKLDPATDYESTTIVWEDVSFSAGQTKSFTFNGIIRRSAPEFASINTQVKVGQTTVSDSTSVQTSARQSSSRSSASSLSSSSARSRVATPNRSVLFSKTADTSEVVSGGTVRYTLYVQNVLLNTIDDAVIVDRFDPTILSVSDAGGGTAAAGQLQWTLPRLLPGQVWQQSYTLSVAGSVATGTELSNVATITGTDVQTASLDEKVVVVKTSIVQNLPSTGAAYDVLFLLMTMPLALTAAIFQRRRI